MKKKKQVNDTRKKNESLQERREGGFVNITKIKKNNKSSEL